MNEDQHLKNCPEARIRNQSRSNWMRERLQAGVCPFFLTLLFLFCNSNRGIQQGHWTHLANNMPRWCGTMDFLATGYFNPSLRLRGSRIWYDKNYTCNIGQLWYNCLYIAIFQDIFHTREGTKSSIVENSKPSLQYKLIGGSICLIK